MLPETRLVTMSSIPHAWSTRQPLSGRPAARPSLCPLSPTGTARQPLSLAAAQPHPHPAAAPSAHSPPAPSRTSYPRCWSSAHTTSSALSLCSQAAGRCCGSRYGACAETLYGSTAGGCRQRGRATSHPPVLRFGFLYRVLCTLITVLYSVLDLPGTW
jgi:hypothetical protein